MHNQQVYNLSGKQQGELKHWQDNLKIDFKSTEKLFGDSFKEEKKKVRIEMHSEMISLSFIKSEIIPSKMANQ